MILLGEIGGLITVLTIIAELVLHPLTWDHSKICVLKKFEEILRAKEKQQEVDSILKQEIQDRMKGKTGDGVIK
jgi:hypothetical protein